MSKLYTILHCVEQTDNIECIRRLAGTVQAKSPEDAYFKSQNENDDDLKKSWSNHSLARSTGTNDLIYENDGPKYIVQDDQLIEITSDNNLRNITLNNKNVINLGDDENLIEKPDEKSDDKKDLKMKKKQKSIENLLSEIMDLKKSKKEHLKNIEKIDLEIDTILCDIKEM